MRDDLVLARSPKLRIREDHEGVHIVMDVEMRSFSYLNRTAGFVLRSVDGARSLGEIKNLLMRRYPAASDRIGLDVDQIIEKFLCEGYIYFPQPVGEASLGPGKERMVE